MRFCDNLRNIRKQKKISQESLAEAVGVSRQSVSKWECGEAYPTMDNIIKLCKVFNCKINNLVHDDLTDIDSLDEDIKMSVVKFKREQQRKMKGISKAIYVIARIGKIVSMIGIVSIAISMIAIVFVASNTKVEDNNRISIFDENISYSRTAEKIEIHYNNKTEYVTKPEEVFILNQIMNCLENKSIYVGIGFIEFAFLILIIALVLMIMIVKHLEILFINIHNGDTPFTKENIEHIRKMAFLMIAAIIVPNICGAVAELIISEDLNIGFELMDAIYVLFLFSMAYIFEYGYEIQLDSKGKMYGEEKE